jgi:hypothetical protein
MAQDEQAAERKPAGKRTAIFGAALVIGFASMLIAGLVNLWPVIEAEPASAAVATRTSSTVRLLFGAITVKLTPGTALLVLVMIVGALGSLIHVATSFADFLGNRRFYLSWSAWYLLRPVVGASLALLLYFAVRGGFLSASAQSSSINPYGIAALAGLAGLFSKQATDKLREVFETLFKVSSRAGDAQRKDNLANAVPMLIAVEPDQLTVGATNVTLALHGAHFIGGATVARVNGTAESTRVLSDQQLELTLPDELLADPGTLRITVHTSLPGSGESQPIAVQVLP